jgi:hypothetical protein
MSAHSILALSLLLLPIPLSFLVPASTAAQPDPWKVRRMRLALIGFSSSTAVIYTACIFFVAWGPQNAGQGQFGRGMLLWSVPCWLLLANLALVLRRAKSVPFPGSERRSASLVSRWRPVAGQTLAWWTLRGAWLLAVIVLATRAPILSGAPLILLLSSLFFLVLGPRLARRQQIDAPEPFLPDLPESTTQLLRGAYARRRAQRAWAVYFLFGTSVVYKTALAFSMAQPETRGLASPLLTAATATFLLFGVAQALAELAGRRRIEKLYRIGAARAPRG